jgi:hypothetical protein
MYPKRRYPTSELQAKNAEHEYTDVGGKEELQLDEA